MTEITVLCGGATASRRRGKRTLELDVRDVAASHQKLRLDLEKITDRLADNAPDVLVDLLEIATYVYSADRLCSRGSDRMRAMGADWRRRFHFKIPVRRLEEWSRTDVVELLCETLAFLSEDSFSFDFEKSGSGGGLEPYLGINQPEIGSFVPDEVLLFSGGLDSLSGAIECLSERGARVALVAHQSSTYVAGRQAELVNTLCARFSPRKIFFAPVWVRKGAQTPVEHTQRLRSFLFVALATVVARMFGKKRISVFENGVTSFNLPIADNVLGTRASRTTHPKVLKQFARLVSVLLNDQIVIENPFLWKTKAEVVRPLAAFPDLVAMTTSCAGVRDLPIHGRQCGVCSQCVGRRLALLAAGLGEAERADAYSVDLFRGGHQSRQAAMLAECMILQAYRFSSFTEARFASAFGQAFRAIGALPGLAAENLFRIYDLHRRYGGQVVEVVNRNLSEAATLETALALPPTSLIARINSPRLDPREEGTSATEAAASVQAGPEPIAPSRRLAFAIAADGRILFDGGVCVTGGAIKLFAILIEQFKSDIAAGAPKSEFQFVGHRTLEAQLGWDGERLRQQVMRTRRHLTTELISTGYDFDEQDILQSRQWRGYRLNPYLLLVEPAQIASTSDASRFNDEDVTARNREPGEQRGSGG